jgi:serine/threonine protein kinase
MDGLIKITDFGVSKKLDLEMQMPYDMRHASVRGTANWMAPEMIIADQVYSAKVYYIKFNFLIYRSTYGHLAALWWR